MHLLVNAMSSYAIYLWFRKLSHATGLATPLWPRRLWELQAELERDTETLKKEVIDIRLLAQRDIVLDPQAEMLEVSLLPHNA